MSQLWKSDHFVCFTHLFNVCYYLFFILLLANESTHSKSSFSEKSNTTTLFSYISWPSATAPVQLNHSTMNILMVLGIIVNQNSTCSQRIHWKFLLVLAWRPEVGCPHSLRSSAHSLYAGLATHTSSPVKPVPCSGWNPPALQDSTHPDWT